MNSPLRLIRAGWPALLAPLFLLFGPGSLEARQATPPPPLPERPIEFPGFEEVTLDNGLRVVLLNYGTQPVASVRLYLPGGRSVEPADRAGIAGMAATVLTRGTERRSALEISQAIEGVGGSLSASAGQDFFTISSFVLTEHLELAFDLLADVLLEATFPDDEVELARTQTLSSLQAQLGQPQVVASRHFASLVYGEGHAYGVQSTPESVRAVTREDLIEYRDRVAQPGDALLVVAGQVDRARVEQLAREYLGGWEGGTAPAAAFPAPPERGTLEIRLVHRPGSVQSVVGLGHLGIRPDDPDYFPLLVLNRVLGGGPDARLFRVLRDERGWTYGAGSSFNRPRDRGIFSVNTEVRTEVTDSTLVEILAQLERMRTEPIPEEELEGARSYLAGSFPLRLETADHVAGQIATSLLLGLPIEDVTRYPDRIRAVDPDDLRRVARSHLHPDRALIVVVGDAPSILERLEAIAPVTIVDVEGRPLDREEFLQEREAVAWDGTRLEEGMRRYEIRVQGNPMGNAEYRLERDGDVWIASVITTAMGSSQETTTRFSVESLEPISLVQEAAQGPISTSADLQVSEGRVQGPLELPEQLGGNRELDLELPPGTLFAGMDEFALQVADLEEGARISIPLLDVTQAQISTLEARVTGAQSISTAAGSFDTWVVELSGGPLPLTLYLRQEAPHVLIRQEFQGQPVLIELIGMGPL